ncbi:MAG: photosynthetic reaction center cytochrome c subunit family protein [Gemmatimonadales bacterium]
MSAAPSDSIQEANNASVAAVLARIGDRRDLPADSVFRNLRLPHLRSIPASRFLGIMSGGYARALGVTCTHCHVPNNYASDDRRPKRAAREMALMHFGLNRQLAGMENLATLPVEERYITCWTCHRGMVRPLSP